MQAQYHVLVVLHCNQVERLIVRNPKHTCTRSRGAAVAAASEAIGGTLRCGGGASRETGAAEMVRGMRTASATIASSTAARAGAGGRRKRLGWAGGGGGRDEARTGGAAAVDDEVGREEVEVVAVDGGDRKRRALQPARTSIRIDHCLCTSGNQLAQVNCGSYWFRNTVLI